MNLRGERVLIPDNKRRYEVEGKRLSYLSSRILGALAEVEGDADLPALRARPHANYALRVLKRHGLIDAECGLTEMGEHFASRLRVPIVFPTSPQETPPRFNDARLPRRFWSKVAEVGACWAWGATKTERGYGRFGVNAVVMAAHRVAYLALVGPIPKELELDHLCRNTACVNPAHLEPVTHQVNVQRGWDAAPGPRVFRGTPFKGNQP